MNYTATVVIEKPIDQVFKDFNDATNISKWIPEIQEVKSIQKTKEVTGSKYTVTVDNQGKEIVLNEEVLAYALNEHIKLKFQGGGMTKTDDYIFNSEADKTVITLTSSIRGDNFVLGCMLPFVKGKLAKQDQQYLDNFKSYILKANDQSDL